MSVGYEDSCIVLKAERESGIGSLCTTLIYIYTRARAHTSFQELHTRTLTTNTKKEGTIRFLLCGERGT